MKTSVSATANGPTIAPQSVAISTGGMLVKEQAPTVTAHLMKKEQRTAIGALLVLTTVLLMTQLVAIWPAVMSATTAAGTGAASTARAPSREMTILFGLGHTTFSTDVALIAMVLLAGGLGALVGTTRRFLDFAVRNELTKRDEWSYIMRPVQGAVLALIVYFTLRGGYLGQAQSAPVNPYGVAALSGLVGLFTRHAVSKLTDVFDTLFGKPKEDADPVKVKPDPPKNQPSVEQPAQGSG